MAGRRAYRDSGASGGHWRDAPSAARPGASNSIRFNLVLDHLASAGALAGLAQCGRHHRSRSRAGAHHPDPPRQRDRGTLERRADTPFRRAGHGDRLAGSRPRPATASPTSRSRGPPGRSHRVPTRRRRAGRLARSFAAASRIHPGGPCRVPTETSRRTGHFAYLHRPSLAGPPPSSHR